MTDDTTMQTVWRSPRSAWLKASAAAVRSYDKRRADLWMELARDLEMYEHLSPAARRQKEQQHASSH